MLVVRRFINQECASKSITIKDEILRQQSKTEGKVAFQVH
ncbi:hypothetical protein SAMN05421787_12010 [Virgibacillus pantothenticus]|nr:hypothetical protein SAMN05421787_12010 [Virgibacillus pantothenticus]